MRCYSITHPGLVRDGNEDCCFRPENGENFAIVCDGMGGHKAGEVASLKAVESMRRELAGKTPGEAALRSAILRANDDVYEMSKSSSAYSGMGTTLTAIWWSDDNVYMGHVGDSRLYCFDGESLRQLSHDHTYVQELVDLGEITESEARVHPRKNLITRAIGTHGEVKVDTQTFERKPGVAYLLCSDGLTNMLEDGEILEILKDGDPAEQLNSLLAGALARGGMDNVTALLALDGEDKA